MTTKEDPSPTPDEPSVFDHPNLGLWSIPHSGPGMEIALAGITIIALILLARQ